MWRDSARRNEGAALTRGLTRPVTRAPPYTNPPASTPPAPTPSTPPAPTPSSHTTTTPTSHALHHTPPAAHTSTARSARWLPPLRPPRRIPRRLLLLLLPAALLPAGGQLRLSLQDCSSSSWYRGCRRWCRPAAPGSRGCRLLLLPAPPLLRPPLLLPAPLLLRPLGALLRLARASNGCLWNM
jgi:hypothetical protein